MLARFRLEADRAPRAYREGGRDGIVQQRRQVILTEASDRCEEHRLAIVGRLREFGIGPSSAQLWPFDIGTQIANNPSEDNRGR